MIKEPFQDQKKQQLLQDSSPREAQSQILSEENFLLVGATSFLGFQYMDVE